MLYQQPAVQSVKHHDNRSGIAAALLPCCPGQQLQDVPLKLHRVVLGHSPAVLQAPDLFQAQLSCQRSERGLRAVGGNLETPVEPRQELFQYGLGLFNGGGSGQPWFCDQPILEGSRRPFHTPMRAGWMGASDVLRLGRGSIPACSGGPAFMVK